MIKAWLLFQSKTLHAALKKQSELSAKDCVLFDLFTVSALFPSVHVLQPQVVKPERDWCTLPRFPCCVSPVTHWSAGTNHRCDPATMCSPVYCFTSASSFVMDKGFVCKCLWSFSARWGLWGRVCVQCVISLPKILGRVLQMFYCLGLLAAALWLFFFTIPAFIAECFFWSIMKSQIKSHGQCAELVTCQCKAPS